MRADMYKCTSKSVCIDACEEICLDTCLVTTMDMRHGHVHRHDGGHVSSELHCLRLTDQQTTIGKRGIKFLIVVRRCVRRPRQVRAHHRVCIHVCAHACRQARTHVHTHVCTDVSTRVQHTPTRISIHVPAHTQTDSFDVVCDHLGKVERVIVRTVPSKGLMGKIGGFGPLVYTCLYTRLYTCLHTCLYTRRRRA